MVNYSTLSLFLDKTILICVEGGLWQDEVILMVLSGVRMGSLII